jgi:NHL repeat
MGTESKAQSLAAAQPAPGYADGAGDVARFDAPTGITVDAVSGVLYIADTNNHAVRLILKDAAHTVYTVAGSFKPAATSASDMAACPPPCLEGVPGHRDGSIVDAEVCVYVCCAMHDNSYCSYMLYNFVFISREQ